MSNLKPQLQVILLLFFLATKLVDVSTKSDTTSVATTFSKIEAEQVAADN